MKGITILGATGSIGASALDVIDQHPQAFRVVGLTAGRNIERLAELVRRYRPVFVAVARREDATRLRERLGDDVTEVGWGVEGAVAAASQPEAELVLTAMVGVVGLRPTLAAIARGATVAIANKEPLVAAGQLCAAAARRSGATLLPVDSEHSAIFQCLRGVRREDVGRLLLTCSGGPFRQLGREALARVSVEQALAHPTWSMGPKISVDSATLINKGLELIEARWLFDLPAERIDVVIHPQSVIHSMVELVDGAVLAQLGTPDMRVPVAHALGYPERLPLDVPRLDWRELSRLSFEEPDEARFPALALARAALAAGGTAPAVLNAANEVAVEAFLAGRIGFVAISDTVARVLDEHQVGPADALEPILAADRWARERASSLVSAAQR